MWQFAEAVRGLADGCATLGVPVTGGNVSFYNQTEHAAIHPTPVVGVLGVHDDVRDRVTIGFASPGASIVLLGETRPEFGGSAWAHVVHGHLGGHPPRVNLTSERQLGHTLMAAAAGAMLDSAHDLSDGGLAVALAESCLRGGRRLPGAAARRPVRVFVQRVGRPRGRGRAARPRGGIRPVVHGPRRARDGPRHRRRGEPRCRGMLRVPLTELAAVHEHILPALFG